MCGKCFIIIALLACAGCSRSRELYSDADLTLHSFNELIATSPLIVVGTVREKTAEGPGGLVARPRGLPAFPAQKYQFTLTVQRSLRGDLAPGQTISVIGYETEDKVLIGPPKGICGQPGNLGVYFLKRSGDSLRVITDSYRIWISLDKQTDLSGLRDADDVAVSIWRLMISPLQEGLKPVTQNGLSKIFDTTNAALGRAKSIALFSNAISTSKSTGFQVETCIFLNKVDWGMGLENCATRLRREPEISDQQKSELEDIIQSAPEATGKMYAALSAGGARQVSFWAQSNDPIKIQEFLCFMAGHPDRKIATLAKDFLASEYPSSICRPIL